MCQHGDFGWRVISKATVVLEWKIKAKWQNLLISPHISITDISVVYLMRWSQVSHNSLKSNMNTDICCFQTINLKLGVVRLLIFENVVAVLRMNHG